MILCLVGEKRFNASLLLYNLNIYLFSNKVGASLVKHLHAFVKDVEPSIEEWEAGVQFLVEAGQWSYHPEKRHEWMFLSDTLGVTMLVDCINHRKKAANSTEWTVQVRISKSLMVKTEFSGKSGHHFSIIFPFCIYNRVGE